MRAITQSTTTQLESFWEKVLGILGALLRNWRERSLTHGQLLMVNTWTKRSWPKELGFPKRKQKLRRGRCRMHWNHGKATWMALCCTVNLALSHTETLWSWQFRTFLPPTPWGKHWRKTSPMLGLRVFTCWWRHLCQMEFAAGLVRRNAIRQNHANGIARNISNMTYLRNRQQGWKRIIPRIILIIILIIILTKQHAQEALQDGFAGGKGW